MIKQFASLASAFIMAAWPLCALRAQVTPGHIWLEVLYKTSDAVVIGHCGSVHALPGSPDSSVMDFDLTFSVARIYKGSDLTAFTILITGRPIASGSPWCGKDPVLLFLKHTNVSGVYTLSEWYHGMKLVPASLLSTKHQGDAPTDGLLELERALGEVAAGVDTNDARQALLILRDFRKIDPQTVSTLKAISLRPNESQRLLGWEILARVDPSSNFRAFTDMFKSQPAQDGEAAMRMCEIAEQLKDPHLLTTLEGMVDWQEYPDLRVCAMQGIRNLHAPETVPFLIRHLDDSQLQVAYDAVITMAEITKLPGDYGPGIPVYSKDPERYKKLWHDWWNQGGAAKYPDRQPK